MTCLIIKCVIMAVVGTEQKVLYTPKNNFAPPIA